MIRVIEFIILVGCIAFAAAAVIRAINNNNNEK